MYCLCVNVYYTLPPGVNPITVNKYFHININTSMHLLQINIWYTKAKQKAQCQKLFQSILLNTSKSQVLQTKISHHGSINFQKI